MGSVGIGGTASASAPRTLTQYPPNVLIDGLSYGERIAGFTRGINVYGDPVAAHEGKVQRLTKEYERRVHALLSMIATHLTGRAVLREIGRSPCVLLIKPFWGSEADSPNAFATTEDVVAATARRRPLRNKVAEIIEPKQRGTGVGSDVTIEFLPSDFASNLSAEDVQAVEKQALPGTLQDEALLHELVHAMRSMSGEFTRGKVPGQPSYHNLEEFYAITITNIYRSECGRRLLRAQHVNFSPMIFEADNFLQVEDNRRHLRELRRQHRQLFSDIHDVEMAKFNPIRLMWG